MSDGAVWLAYGKSAEYQARESVKAYLEHNDTPTRVFAGEHEDNKQASRYFKTNLMQWHTFDHFVYLDADTRVRASLAPVFDALHDGFDLVMAFSANQDNDAFWHISQDEIDFTLDQLGYLPLQLQCGVLGVSRNERTTRFFDMWRHEWLKYAGNDQAAFLRALDLVPLKIWLLGRPWNGGAAINHNFGALRQ